MRKKLGEHKEQRLRFKGNFERYGTKSNHYTGYLEKTVLLSNVFVVETNEPITNHIWLNLTKGLASLGELQPGDLIEFDARVKGYTKGYFGHNEEARLLNPPKRDYKLSHPTKFEKAGSRSQ